MDFILSFILGFFIAAVGIIAPGMLNMTIAKLSINESKKQALLFAFGASVVILIQCFIGVYFAKFLVSHPVIFDNLKKFGTIIFVVLTFVFLYLGLKSKKPKVEVEIKDKKNRILFGASLSALNMLAIPYYVFTSLTAASKNGFDFSIISIVIFSVAAALGSYFVFYLYAILFKKVEHRVGFITNNINFLIAAITGIVALSSIYKMIST
jgi:threonine/homoserine/homoserine lactone efflux protein